MIFERTRFNRRVQLVGESAEPFIVELYNLAVLQLQRVDFKDDAWQDCHRNSWNRHLYESLQLDSELTLEKAKKVIRQRKAVQGQQNALSGATGEPSNSLDRLQGNSTRRKSDNFQSNRYQQDEDRRPRQPAVKQCSRCGKGPHGREKMLYVINVNERDIFFHAA